MRGDEPMQGVSGRIDRPTAHFEAPPRQGRLTRVITDLALAQAENQAIRFYAMSASILAVRPDYYRILEVSQKAGLDVTPWLETP